MADVKLQEALDGLRALLSSAVEGHPAARNTWEDENTFMAPITSVAGIVPATTNEVDFGAPGKNWRNGHFAGIITAKSLAAPILNASAGIVLNGQEINEWPDIVPKMHEIRIEESSTDSLIVSKTQHPELGEFDFSKCSVEVFYKTPDGAWAQMPDSELQNKIFSEHEIRVEKCPECIHQNAPYKLRLIEHKRVAA